MNQLDSARIFTEAGYEMAEKEKDREGKAIAQNNLGNIYAKMNQPGVAMEYYRLSIPDYTAENDEAGICQSALGMAVLFRKKGQMDSALYYARLSMNKAMKAGFIPDELNASIFLTDYFKRNNDINRAFASQQITLAAKDSLFNQEKTREFQNLSYEEIMRQQEIEEQKKRQSENARKAIQLRAIAFFIPSLFLFALLLSRRKIKPGIIEFLGILSLLFMFEFLTLLIHPYIEHWTHDSPVIMLLILVVIAAFLVPFHHKLEHWVKQKLVHRENRQPDPVPEEMAPACESIPPASEKMAPAPESIPPIGGKPDNPPI